MKKLVIIFALLITANLSGQVADNKKPFVIGETRSLRSSILGEERVINVYLPEGYSDKDTIKYPVIYLLDGSADEDFIHIAGLVQFYSFEWINYLPKSIVVGIATVDRRRDFTYPTTVEEQKKQFPTTGGSAKFISFIEKELQPFVEKTYRISKNSTVIGQSLGGLVLTEILLSKPFLFNKYIIVSPSLWWDNGSLLKQSTQELEKSADSINVFIAVGKEGLTPGSNARLMEDDVKQLAEKLKQVKNTKLKVYFDYLPEEDHATIMHQAVMEAFKVLRGLF